MAYRIIVRRTGGPEALEVEEFDPPAPGANEVLIEQRAVGLNFIDIYQRTGLYPMELPATPGGEAAGVVAAVGEGAGWSVGDRVGYPAASGGAYASHRLMPADRLVALPDTLGFEEAAAIMLKGCTVEMLAERCAHVQQGDWVLAHAAAGGVGSILVPWLTAIGARVIAHAGTDAKAAQAKQAGAEAALSCRFDALAEEVKRITGGAGVRTVFDGVGKASWSASLASLARRGLMVSFGNASGPVDPISPLALSRGGSLYLTRPTLFDYIRTREELAASAERLFEMVGRGVVRPMIGQRFPLREAAEAQRRVEARETTGSTVLIP